ncbi:hypothetical protein STCU_11299 [Strigomonas culicis]|uniref:Uncharacterized protein n=1 Tax=Strigomonas culicis TaxID=28005 RepID=S9UNZ5_9TRYP|nr:hypothetical protein STCU_11299 [Strigomonas culicis]|eukprot:EPY16411.1 hypothetical protein STCU_11299 [Strigomonas culicis]
MEMEAAVTVVRVMVRLNTGIVVETVLEKPVKVKPLPVTLQSEMELTDWGLEAVIVLIMYVTSLISALDNEKLPVMEFVVAACVE